MRELLMIACGGALGAVGRHALVAWIHDQLGLRFAVGTLLVNLLGSTLIGVLYVLVIERAQLHADWRELLMIGFLGAFTTFSTFSLDAVLMWQSGSIAWAAVYVGASVLLCLAGAGAGMQVARLLLA